MVLCIITALCLLIVLIYLLWEMSKCVAKDKSISGWFLVVSIGAIGIAFALGVVLCKLTTLI